MKWHCVGPSSCQFYWITIMTLSSRKKFNFPKTRFSPERPLATTNCRTATSALWWWQIIITFVTGSHELWRRKLLIYGVISLRTISSWGNKQLGSRPSPVKYANSSTWHRPNKTLWQADIKLKYWSLAQAPRTRFGRGAGSTQPSQICLWKKKNTPKML